MKNHCVPGDDAQYQKIFAVNDIDIGTIRSAMNDNDLVWVVSPDYLH